jgi:phosphoribosylamine--glycine ligase
MIAPDGTPKVLEFNCRLGDPETQPLLMRLRSDLVALCLAAFDGQLDQMVVDWDPRPALGVVLAAGGYPDPHAVGQLITGVDSVPPSEAMIFHAGTRLVDGALVTNGGRVLCVTALGERVALAQRRAYQALDQIHWEGAFCRRDIGYRAIARENATAS